MKVLRNEGLGQRFMGCSPGRHGSDDLFDVWGQCIQFRVPRTQFMAFMSGSVSCLVRP